MLKRKIVAYIAATTLLGGALVYYNFIDKAAVSGAKKGNKCPDFTAQTFMVEGDTFSLSTETFTLSEKIGKVCVVNFWETWCQACIEELPEFNEIQKEFAGEVEVIAVVGVTSTTEFACEWMTNKEWNAYDTVSDWADFSLTFAYLPSDTCKQLGCSGMLPRTVIVDKSGVIAHEQDGAMTHSELQTILSNLV